MIWRSTFPGSRRVFLQYIQNPRLHYPKPPISSKVCHLSREETLKHYTILYGAGKRIEWTDTHEDEQWGYQPATVTRYKRDVLFNLDNDMLRFGFIPGSNAPFLSTDLGPFLENHGQTLRKCRTIELCVPH